MSPAQSSTARPARPRKLQDDLLDDLRGAAPVPVLPPAAAHPAPVPVPTERPDDRDPAAVTVEVRVTPRRWSAPRIRTSARGIGVVVVAGPVRFSSSVGG